MSIKLQPLTTCYRLRADLPAPRPLRRGTYTYTPLSRHSESCQYLSDMYKRTNQSLYSVQAVGGILNPSEEGSRLFKLARCSHSSALRGAVQKPCADFRLRPARGSKRLTTIEARGAPTVSCYPTLQLPCLFCYCSHHTYNLD